MSERLSADQILIRKEICLEREKIRGIIATITKFDNPEEYDFLKRELAARINHVIKLQKRLKTL